MTIESSLRRTQSAPVAVGTVPTDAIDTHAGRRVADSYLCSLAYVEPQLAEYMVDEFLHDSTHAIQPSFGLDLVALARHARAACRITSQVTAVLAVNLLAAVAAAATYAWMTVDLSGAVAVEQQVRSLAKAGAIILVACWLVAWFALAYERTRRYTRIRTLLRRPSASRRLAPPLATPEESRLTEAMTGNVTVFRGGEPFAGHGDIVGKWSIDVDLTKPATGERGWPKQIVPLTASEVHGAIAESIRRSGVPDLRIENRLFVRGAGVPAVPGLLPHRFRRPRSTLPPEMIVRGVERPTPTARTYLCVEKVAWSGDLVLTVLIRAEVIGGANLYVEFYACGLLPLAPFARRPEQMPKSRPEILLRVLRDVGLLRPLRRTFAVPGYLAARAAAKVHAAHRRIRETTRIRQGHVFDYGPVSYFREGSSDVDHYERFAQVDEDMHIKIVARRALGAVRNVLAAHGVDTSEFDHLEKQVSNTVYNIGNINGSGNAFGSHNNVSSGRSSSGRPGSGPGASPRS